MIFLSLENGGAVALDQVYRHWWNDGLIQIETKTGERFATTQHLWELANARALVGVLPAEPNTVYLTPLQQDDGSTVYEHDPVIGWAVRPDGYVTPIGADGLDEMDRAVMFPSGKVTKGLSGDWPSKDDYIASEERKAASLSRLPEP